MWRAVRIRPAALVVVAGVTLIAALQIGTVMLISNLRDRALADNERELRNTALILAEQTDRAFQSLALVEDNVIAHMENLWLESRDDFRNRMAGRDVHVMLSHKISGMPHVDSLALFDADGRLVVSSRHWPARDVSVADRDYFQGLKNDPAARTYLSIPHQNRATGTWNFVHARKLTDQSGTFLGVVIASSQLAHFEQFFGSIVLRKNSSISLFRADGVLLARFPRIEGAIGKIYTGVLGALNRKDGAIRLVGRMDGKDRILVVRKAAHFPLVVSVGLDFDAALAEWRRNANFLAVAVVLVTLLIALLGGLIVRQIQRGGREQRMQLDIALNNMSHGLCMFDADSRLVLFNKRYIEMYGLSPKIVHPGCSLQDVIRHRVETGTFAGSAEQYVNDILATVRQGYPTSKVVENGDGRMVLVSHNPLPEGGWVVTHEDITERHRAETKAQRAHARLREVIEMMPAGLVFYDEEERLQLWNRYYDEIYPDTADLRKVGVRFEDLIRAGLKRGMYADAAGREEEWLAQRLALHRQSRKRHEQQLTNGRWARIEDCRLSDGGFVGIRVDITKLKQRERELELQNMRFQAALQHMSPGLAMFDRERQLIVCNSRYADLYRLPPELTKPGTTQRQILEHRIESGLFTGPVAERYFHSRLASTPHDRNADSILELTDGRIIAVADRGTADGGWVSTHDDITLQRRAEQQRDRNRKFLDLVIENVPTAIFVKDAADRRFVLINRAGEQLVGASRDTLTGRTAHECFDRDHAAVITARDDELLRTDTAIFIDEHRIPTPNNGERIVTSRRLVLRDENGAPLYLLGVIEDVTERRQADERIAHLANYDVLTDLPNRALFRQRLTEALARVRRGEYVAVLYLDLDYFKHVNDSLGHPTGDELLKAVADRLRQCAGEADTVARLGGDEFAIIQSRMGKVDDATVFVSRVFAAIREPYDLDGLQLIADASIGIAVAPDDGTEPDQLLKNADLALYGAKADGRGTYRFFEPEMDARVRARRSLESDLRKALARGEFELHYQPQIDLQTRAITGCEALIRWRHPERGLIPPAEFIPIAEETGLIIPIGEWVLSHACATAATWPAHVKLAVNLSPVQFKSVTLSQRVVAALGISGLSPRRLELEITESVLMQNSEALLATLHQLHDLGVRFALDDFGTGFSSLSYLRSFPFDKIKIDRSFVKDLHDKSEALAIIRAVISLADSLNMTTTAEGVETQQQLDLLGDAGCTEMQGYLFSRPLPEADIAGLLVSHPCAAATAA